MTRHRFIEFDEFIKSTFSAKASDFSSRKETRVASEREFKKMRAYILSLYRGVTVKHSFVTRTGQYVDCVPFEQQPSLRGSASRLREAEKIVASPPPPPASPERTTDDSAVLAGRLVGVGLRDEFGNEMDCPEGCIPMRRITLELLTTFKRLSDFFAKPSPPRTIPPLTNRDSRQDVEYQYATGYQYVANQGVQSNINLWSPLTTPETEHSLSQIWVEGEAPDRNEDHLQSIEMGWIVSPRYYKTDEACLFVFYTADGHSRGCYNVECPGFVQKDNSIPLGTTGYFKDFSSLGGTQCQFTAGIFLYPYNYWYVYVDDKFLGYYPISAFANNPYNNQLTRYSNLIQFGGEIACLATPYPQMGSGLFAQRFYGYAAYQADIQYATLENAIEPTKLTQITPNPIDFTALIYTSGRTQKIYFGGPGRLYLVYHREDDLFTAYYDGFQWAGDTKIKDQTGGIAPRSSAHPAATVYEAHLYLIYKGVDSDHDLRTAYFDGRRWYGDEKIKDQPGGIGPRSKHAPAAAVYTVNGKKRLYLAYRGSSDDNEKIYTAYYEEGKWYGDESIKEQSGNVIAPRSRWSPALAVCTVNGQERLYLVYTDADTGELYMTYFDGSSWYHNSRITVSGRSLVNSHPGPNACVYNNLLYVVVLGQPDRSGGVIYYDGYQWHVESTFEDNTSSAPSAIRYNTRLYLAYRTSSDDDDLSTGYCDDSVWHASGTIKSQSGEKINPRSTGSPGMAVY